MMNSCSSQHEKKEALQETVSPDSAMIHQALIERGGYLVNTFGCNDCHTPKTMGERGPEFVADRILSGYPADRQLKKVDMSALKNGWVLFNEDLTQAVGPWGISFSANLTSDESGIGLWTEDQFKKALTQGKFNGLDGGRMLLPPMPWQNFMNMKDEDVKAIFYYLKSIKPVRNIVPAPIPPQEIK